MPRNHEHIHRMASFFARRCSAEFQLHAIAEMLGIGKADLLCAEGLDIAGADVAQILADTQIGLSECRTIPYPKSCQGHLHEAEASDRISPRQKA